MIFNKKKYAIVVFEIWENGNLAGWGNLNIFYRPKEAGQIYDLVLQRVASDVGCLPKECRIVGVFPL